MKKGLLIVLVLLVLPMTTFAQQSKHFSAGKMVASAGAGFSVFGLGYGVGFEYGITDKFGIYPSYMMNSWENGFNTWSFNVIDVWATYHDKSISNMFGSGDKIDAYYMVGATFVSLGVETAGASDETGSSIAFGGGAGGRYYFNDKVSAYGEGKYRFATLEAGNQTVGAITWYSINFGVSYAIN